MPSSVGGGAGVDEETYVTKYRVTMVSWSTDDKFVITAVNDFSLKVWNSHSGQLVHMLQVHISADLIRFD